MQSTRRRRRSFSIVVAAFGDDCGETLVESPWARSKFAQDRYPLATYLGPPIVASLTQSAAAPGSRL